MLADIEVGKKKKRHKRRQIDRSNPTKQDKFFDLHTRSNLACLLAVLPQVMLVRDSKLGKIHKVQMSNGKNPRITAEYLDLRPISEVKIFHHQWRTHRPRTEMEGVHTSKKMSIFIGLDEANYYMVKKYFLKILGVPWHMPIWD